MHVAVLVRLGGHLSEETIHKHGLPGFVIRNKSNKRNWLSEIRETDYQAKVICVSDTKAAKLEGPKCKKPFCLNDLST